MSGEYFGTKELVFIKTVNAIEKMNIIHEFLFKGSRLSNCI